MPHNKDEDSRERTFNAPGEGAGNESGHDAGNAPAGDAINAPANNSAGDAVNAEANSSAGDFILLADSDRPENRPLTRFRSIFSLRNGIFSPLERIRLKYPDAKIFFSHPDAEYESLIAEMEETLPASKNAPPSGALTVTDEEVNACKMTDRIGEMIAGDIAILDRSFKYEDDRTNFKHGDDQTIIEQNFFGVAPQIVGPPGQLIVNANARVKPGVVFDTTAGPVILDDGAVVSPFSYLEGPLYAGRHSRIDNARIVGGAIIGRHVRAGGEIEKSIINDFSNKHHEGFLGHSVLGSWVNLGALTTTSDLKNNYGEIRLLLPGDPIPRPASMSDKISAAGRDIITDNLNRRNPANTTDLNEISLITINTGSIKFGAIIADCVKTAIGAMISTGTVIDVGCNIFGKNPEKYMPPFCWGDAGRRYQPERFLTDYKKIAERRKERIPPNLIRLIKRMHGATG